MRQFLLLGVFFCSLVLVACTSAKQHAMLQQEKMGGVASASVVKLTPSADGRQTNVILRVNYRNQTHEEILLSFVWVKDRWRLR